MVFRFCFKISTDQFNYIQIFLNFQNDIFNQIKWCFDFASEFPLINLNIIILLNICKFKWKATIYILNFKILKFQMKFKKY